MTTKRRICWPNPDATCLNGGCIYCNEHPFRSLRTIWNWCLKADRIDQRCVPTQEYAVEAYRWGAQHGWGNAEVK